MSGSTAEENAAAERKRVEKMQAAALGRRGNSRVRADVEAATRVFDPAHDAAWHKRYKFYSGQHMKGCYRTFARARHDPFNKNYTWGISIIKKVANEMAQEGQTAKQLFENVNCTGAAMLGRPEVTKALSAVLPVLSEMEVTAMFDHIDQDRSGLVSIQELESALESGKACDIPEGSEHAWRNPIHHIVRYPPARPEGWDHLDHTSKGGSRNNYEKQCEIETKNVMERLASTLKASPRSVEHHHFGGDAYDTFGGGACSGRFRRHGWTQKIADGKEGLSAPQFKDPGIDLRPGFLCDSVGRSTLVAKGFSALTPRVGRTARASVVKAPQSARK